MLDWLTLRLPVEHVPPATLAVLRDRAGRVTKTDADGQIEWCIAARDSVRSDSHQVQVHVGAHKVELSGSPARVHGENNVFGSGDAVVCWSAMVRFVSRQVGPLPINAALWELSRVDVTHNYALKDAAEVRQALAYLRHVEGGRLQVRTSSESVYWSPQSRMRSAKAYHKGPHLRYQLDKGKAAAAEWQLEAADRLLRLEVALRGEWWRRERRRWWEMTEGDYDQEHENFFSQVVGKVEVPCMDMMSEVERVAKTKGQGRAAYRTWLLIKQCGAEQARSMMPRSTWHLHKKILFAAGLTFADFHAGNVVPLRRRTIVLDQPVRSWDELRAA